MASSGTVVVNMATLEAAHDLTKKKSVQIGKLYRFRWFNPNVWVNNHISQKSPSRQLRETNPNGPLNSSFLAWIATTRTRASTS